MANAHIHSKSSARKFGGTPEDYLAIQIKMDCSKAYISSNIHRALTHHSFWIHEVAHLQGVYFLQTTKMNMTNLI